MSERFQSEWKSAKQQETNRLAADYYSPTKSMKTSTYSGSPVSHGDFARSVHRMSEAELSLHGFFLGALDKHHGF